jgi:adenylate cyclase
MHSSPATLAPDGTDAEAVAVLRDPDQEVTATFCFVDIASYTALTDTHGERAAADLVDGFNRLIESAVAGRGHVQELSGDNAFLVFPDPVAAMQAIAILYREVAGLQAFPILRCGMHHGPALRRADRYFGSTINTAARIAAQATGGEILGTAPIAHALASSTGSNYAIASFGSVKLRNLPQKVDLYRIALPGSSNPFAIDPVCQMQVDIRSATSSSQFDGRQYWFCSSPCFSRFTKAPSDFV